MEWSLVFSLKVKHYSIKQEREVVRVHLMNTECQANLKNGGALDTVNTAVSKTNNIPEVASLLSGLLLGFQRPSFFLLTLALCSEATPNTTGCANKQNAPGF